MRQIDPLQSFDSIYICLTRAATLFTGSRRKDHKANLLSEIHNLIRKQITLAHTAHATAELPQYNHKMRDTLNNKMSIFSHKDVFVRGMKDAQAYCFWPQTFPSVDVCKAKIALFFPRPVCNMKAGSGSFFLTQINKQPRSSLSEMACRDTLVGAAAGLSWWMTEKLTLRSTTARALISFCCRERRKQTRGT